VLVTTLESVTGIYKSINFAYLLNQEIPEALRCFSKLRHYILTKAKSPKSGSARQEG